MDDKHGVGVLSQDPVQSAVFVQVIPEERQQPEAHADADDGLPERIGEREPVEPACQ
jgi:hypothetical protein